MVNYRDFGQRIRTLRRQQPLTQEALAAQLAREIVARGITAIKPQYNWGNG